MGARGRRSLLPPLFLCAGLGLGLGAVEAHAGRTEGQSSQPASTPVPAEPAAPPSWREELLTEMESALSALALDERERHLRRSEALLDRARGPGAGELRFHWLHVAALLQHSHFDLQGARERFERMRAAQPRSPDALLGLGTIQEARAASPDLALALSAAAGKGFFDRSRRDEIAGEAARYYREALAADPALHEARLRLGRVLQFRRRPREARPELERVVNGPAPAPLRYLAHLFLGELFDGRSDWAEAQAHYRAAITLEPGAQSARLALAEGCGRRGDEAGARRELLALLVGDEGGGGDPWAVYFHPSPGRLAAALTGLREAAARAEEAP